LKTLRSKLYFLDGLRGLAALYVLIHHARWVLWEGFYEGFLRHPELYNWWNTFLVYFFALFKYGHEAVILFFVLSGFVIHLRYSFTISELSGAARFDFIPYLKRRFKRIFPPLLLALVFTFVVDCIGAYLQLPIYAFPSPYASINTNLIPTHSLISLIGNLAFLMKVYVPVWGTDGPLWSLAYEWWFYMLYPFFFFVSRKNPWLPFILLSVFSLLANTFTIFPIHLLNYVFGLMLTWWFGAFLADVFTASIHIPFKKLMYLGLLPLSFFIVGFFVVLPMAANYHYTLCGIGFLSIFAALFHFNRKNNLQFLDKLRFLGDISYSVYVLHMPVLVLLSGLIMAASPDNTLPENFNYVILGIALGLGLGYTGYLIAEKPFLKKK